MIEKYTPVTRDRNANHPNANASDAGASIMHIHFRQQEEGAGYLPSWEPEVAIATCDAVRAAVASLTAEHAVGVSSSAWIHATRS